MKKLSRIKLNDATVMNRNEMKMVTGGTTKEEYCNTVWQIISNNPEVLMDDKSCAGAAHAGEICGWKINC